MKIPPYRLETHRGASGAYPEDTMLAFAKAREAGALSIETDVPLLADGGLAVFHDGALGRTGAGDASLDALTSAESGMMDAGAWRGQEFAGEKVPLLEDLLQWQADTSMRFNLEMKGYGARQGEAVSALAAQLAGVQPGLNMVSSFDASFLAALQTTLPAMPRDLISGELPEEWQELAARLGLDALYLDKDIVTPGMQEAIHSAGLRVRVWTVNEPADMKRMIDAGVDTVITDVPEAFL
jgi:glycerophosphoryl diester phosphodiesterase